MSPELLANFQAFEGRWKNQSQIVEAQFATDPAFNLAFARLVSMQAWRSELFDAELCDGSAQFALEGQNDLLTAYILARTGQWRPSLQAQRSAIEAYLNALYFMDHPVELALWEAGRLKTHFSDQIKYLSDHPKIYPKGLKFSGISILKDEYATLSKAVHGSAKAFWMTQAGGPSYFSSDQISKNMWISRNKMVIRALNLLFISLFRDHLVGTKKRNLRKSVAFALKAKDKPWIKQVFDVTIPFA